MRILVALLLVVGLVACQTAPTTPEPDPDPDPLAVSFRTYYASSSTTQLTLEDVIANRPVTLDIYANCSLRLPRDESWPAYYGGTAAVETQGSDRTLAMVDSFPNTNAQSINCLDIVGETADGEVVTITQR